VISATAPMTAALAARTLSRRGAAANVALMVPEAYSPVMASTPATPKSSTPMSMPTSVLLTDMPPLVALLPPVARAMPAGAQTARARVSQVERRLRSLIHSMRARCRNRYLPGGWCLARAVMTCSLPGTGHYRR
jgi:hypothetical protein